MIKTGLVWTGVALLMMLAIGAWAAWQLPATGEIPVHWDISGEADRYGTRAEALFLIFMFPAVIAAASIVFAIAPMIDPFKTGLRRSSRAYLATWLSVVALMTAVTGGMAVIFVRGAGGETDLGFDFARFVIAGASLMVVVLGNYLPKTRQSFFLGVRTPWTLTSATTWEKTHRLAGKLFILSGLVGLISAFALNGIWAILPLSISIGVASVACVIYSYIAWRGASDRNEGPHFVA